MPAADLYRRNQITDRPWNHDANRHLAVIGCVGRVQGAIAGIEPYLAGDDRAKLVGQSS
jgi:hypothetical protein